MATKTDLQSLSKEELIKLLEVANAKAAHFEKETKKALDKNSKLAVSYEKKIAATNKKLADATLEKEEFKKKANAYETRLKNIAALNEDRMEMMNEICKRIQKDYVIFDKATLATVEEQLEATYQHLGQWILNASVYRHMLFGSGRDLSYDSVAISNNANAGNGQNGAETATDGEQASTDSNNTEDTATQASKATQFMSLALSTMDGLNKTCKHFSKNAKELKAEEFGACGDAITDINNTEVPDEEQKNKKPSTGRKKKDWKPTRKAHPRSTPKASDLECPHCHKPYAATGEMLNQKMLSTKADILEVFEYIETNEPFHFCENCGHVHVVLNENEDIPIQPDMEIGVDIMLMCCESIFNGIPLNRIAKQLKEEFGIGHSTLQRALRVFVRNYLSHVSDEILSHVKAAAHLIVDGTPFNVLENQGRGNCVNKDPARKINSNEPAPEEVIKGISNYILSACSVPLAGKQFAYYGFLPTRSYKSIDQVLTDDFQVNTIICDAFGGYDTLAKERKLKIQNCLVHFRRYIIRALEPKQLAEELLAMPDDKLHEYITGLHHKGDDIMLLYWAFEGISKIYSLERSVDQNSPDVLDQIKQVRQRERKLMQDVDDIMQQMVTRHMKVKKNGEMQRDRSDIYSSVATYWYNNHENFVTYLDDPMVPPDSNRVEQAIRTITILRKNSYHMTSQQGIRDLCTIFTVFESLRRMGVKKPTAVLKPYCRALYNHIVDEWYTQKVYDDGIEGLSKKNVSWKMKALSKGFDFKGCFKELFKDYPKF